VRIDFKSAWGLIDMNQCSNYTGRRRNTKLAKEKFEQVGWVPFLEKFKGYHEGVSLAFSQTYDDESVQFGEMKLTITEATIAEATGFPSSGEKYFKGVIIDKNFVRSF
jgi:hypothetical protein